jgi:3-hydroxybutyryl-CoA dehydrogenase
VRTLGVLGAGQMGLGIAFVAAVRAQIPRVLLCDNSEAQLQKSLSLMDKLLQKDVSKGKMSETDAKDARSRVHIVSNGMEGFKECDMVVEVRRHDVAMLSTAQCGPRLRPRTSP